MLCAKCHKELNEADYFEEICKYQTVEMRSIKKYCFDCGINRLVQGLTGERYSKSSTDSIRGEA